MIIVCIDISTNCLQRLSKKLGLEVAPGRCFKHLLFFDDQFVITQAGGDANYMCNRLVDKFK